jgi:protein-disulfide isomerase
MKNAGDGVAAKIGDITITDKEVYSGIEADLYDAEMKVFQIKFAKLNQLVVEKIIAKDPKSKGMTNDQFFEKNIYSKIKVSSKEFNDFVAEKKIPKQQINPQITEKIKNYLTMQKKEAALKNWLGGKTSKSGIEVFMEKPTRPSFDVSTDGSPFAGGENAKVTLVEFSDFQCPYCAEGSKILKTLKKKYGNKIKVVMKQFPLPFHSQAKKAAMAALCANEQDKAKFWSMHDKMFADQSKLKVADLKALAKSLGLKSEQFDKCLDDNKYMAAIEKDIQDGKSVGVKSTPTFFVNGKLIAGAVPVDEFSELIDQELAQ